MLKLLCKVSATALALANERCPIALYIPATVCGRLFWVVQYERAQTENSRLVHPDGCAGEVKAHRQQAGNARQL